MLKIGVVGAGHLGKIHINQIKEITDYQLVGFHDSSADVRNSVSESTNARPFESLQELISNCDVLDVVTPTFAHLAVASEAIRQSKHVFIEKPLANNPEEGRQIAALAREAGVKVQVGHVERFNPAFTAAAEFIKNPMFIETHRLAQFNPRGTDVSVVLDLMIHDIDIILSLVKSPIKRINASGVAVVSDTPDIANARIEFDNGCVANLTSSRISLKNMRKSRFFQRDAYISVDFLEKKSEVVRLKTVTGEPDPFAFTIDLGPDKGIKQIIFDNPPIKETNAIRTELAMFAKSILANEQPLVSVEDGLIALETAHTIIEKLKTGQPMA
ncbi:MAG: Gfo/Idh/MocA family protein [Arcticibacter sp.]